MTRNRVFLLIGAGALAAVVCIFVLFPTTRYWARAHKIESAVVAVFATTAFHFYSMPTRLPASPLASQAKSA